ncbi:MAG: hypothetical protein DRP56_09320 [Planctomycetota bacterium]|nr:MAG: hypothetical protein DRP56_09320 [Planctomycetota bacterium]
MEHPKKEQNPVIDHQLPINQYPQHHLWLFLIYNLRNLCNRWTKKAKNGAVWDKFGVFLDNFGVVWAQFGVVSAYFGNEKTQKSRVFGIKNQENTLTKARRRKPPDCVYEKRRRYIGRLAPLRFCFLMGVSVCRLRILARSFCLLRGARYSLMVLSFRLS